jgi:Flp pilus assembly pilin Flp
MIKRYFEEEDGQVLVEYGLLISLLALISILSLRFLGNAMKNSFNRTTNAMDTSSN